jgi:dTDP-4-amino-4,6-dideoxygalactose transaminase
MTDVQAAVGIEQLKRLEDIVARRRRHANTYSRLLNEHLPDIRPPKEPAYARSNWQSYCIGLPPRADQRRVMQFMLDAGIATRRGIMCIHREPAYAGFEIREPLTHSEQAQDTCLILPLYPQMTPAIQEQVVDTLAKALA